VPAGLGLGTQQVRWDNHQGGRTDGCSNEREVQSRVIINPMPEHDQAGINPQELGSPGVADLDLGTQDLPNKPIGLDQSFGFCDWCPAQGHGPYLDQEAASCNRQLTLLIVAIQHLELAGLRGFSNSESHDYGFELNLQNSRSSNTPELWSSIAWWHPAWSRSTQRLVRCSRQHHLSNQRVVARWQQPGVVRRAWE